VVFLDRGEKSEIKIIQIIRIKKNNQAIDEDSQKGLLHINRETSSETTRTSGIPSLVEVDAEDEVDVENGVDEEEVLWVPLRAIATESMIHSN
jgi:hypothetical protein